MVVFHLGNSLAYEGLVPHIFVKKQWEACFIYKIAHKRKGLVYQLKYGLQKRITKLLGRQPDLPKREEERQEGNPYLPKLRTILEQVLAGYGMAYQNFCPLLIDTDTPPESMLDIDDVALVLEQVSSDLNYLKIATDRPAYFNAYIERMYEDTGLVVQTEGKSQVSLAGVNVILDMERKGDGTRKYIQEGILYLPIYKRPWKRVEMAQNLDISIPIGYNTVIVKV